MSNLNGAASKPEPVATGLRIVIYPLVELTEDEHNKLVVAFADVLVELHGLPDSEEEPVRSLVVSEAVYDPDFGEESWVERIARSDEAFALLMPGALASEDEESD